MRYEAYQAFAFEWTHFNNLITHCKDMKSFSEHLKYFKKYMSDPSSSIQSEPFCKVSESLYTNTTEY